MYVRNFAGLTRKARPNAGHHGDRAYAHARLLFVRAAAGCGPGRPLSRFGYRAAPMTVNQRRGLSAGATAASAGTLPRLGRLGPVTLRTWSLPTRLQGLGALVIYATVWLGHYVPALVLHPGLPQLDQSSMDPNFFVWSLRWWPYSVAHGINPMATNLIGAPAGFNLSWLTTVPVIALLAAPVTAIFGPIVTFNLLVAIAPPLAAWAAFVLCRRLTGRFWPAFAGGVVYGFSAYEMDHTVAGHLNLTFCLLLPLIAYLVLLWRDGRVSSVLFVTVLALGLILQALIFLETFAGLTLFWVAGLLAAYLLADRSLRPMIARLSRNVGFAYLAAVVLLLPYFIYVIANAPVGYSLITPRANSLNLESLIVPRPSRTLGIGWLHHASARLPDYSLAGYVGVPLLLLVLGLALWSWDRKITRFLVIMFVLSILVALGPDVSVGGLHTIPLPWALLWKLPFARSAFPVRFVVFGYLALAVMVSVWLSAPLRLTALRWVLAAVAVAAVIVNIPRIVAPHPDPRSELPSFITSGEYKRYLTRGETVLVISDRGNAGMLFSAETGFYFKVVGGFVNQAMTGGDGRGTDLPSWVSSLQYPTATTDQDASYLLRHAGIGAVLFENNFPRPGLLSAFDGLGLRSRVIGGITLFNLQHGGPPPAARSQAIG
jgi:hypothetical protein